MSTYAQEWVWRHSRATGIVKYVFLAIARRVLKSRVETAPTTVASLAEITGLGESTVRKSIQALKQNGEIDVLAAGRRGTVHKYRLVRELKLPLIDVDGPSDDGSPLPRSTDTPLSRSGDEASPRDGHRSDVAVSALPHSTESPPPESGVSATRERCERYDVAVSALAGSGAVRTDSSQVRTKKDLKEILKESTTAAAPQFSQQSRDPNANGNYRVIARLAFEVAERGWWIEPLSGGERLTIANESDLVSALKCECAMHLVDYGRHPDVDLDVVHRAAASEWFKRTHPDIAGRRIGAAR